MHLHHIIFLISKKYTLIFLFVQISHNLYLGIYECLYYKGSSTKNALSIIVLVVNVFRKENHVEKMQNVVDLDDIKSFGVIYIHTLTPKVPCVKIAKIAKIYPFLFQVL